MVMGVLMGVVMAAPSTLPKKATVTTTAAKVVTKNLDSGDVANFSKQILPLILKSLSIFSVNGNNSNSFSTGDFSNTFSTGDFSNSFSTDNVGGLDSPFVPNYVIPGYTIPGNRFSPDIKIPSIRIQ